MEHGDDRLRTHLLVKDDAEMAKKVAPDCVATALPIIVLPVPGGPKRSKPTTLIKSPFDDCKAPTSLVNYLLDTRATQ